MGTMTGEDEWQSVCPLCLGDGCQSCAYTGRGDTHPDDCDCVLHNPPTEGATIP